MTLSHAIVHQYRVRCDRCNREHVGDDGGWRAHGPAAIDDAAASGWQHMELSGRDFCPACFELWEAEEEADADIPTDEEWYRGQDALEQDRRDKAFDHAQLIQDA